LTPRDHISHANWLLPRDAHEDATHCMYRVKLTQAGDKKFIQAA